MMIIDKLIPSEPVTWMKENNEKVGILVIRYLMAFVWLSQGFAKAIFRDSDPYKDFNNFLSEVNYMRVTNPIPFVVDILENIIIPNITSFAILVIIIELTIGFSLALGIFTRFGSILGGFMTLQLWILTLGWDEWIWTYPLIFFPHVLLFLSRSGKDVGIDRIFDGNNSLLSKLG